MKTFAPSYYNNFKCIAGSCRHNCCIGWEIDIDNDTYNYYKTVKGKFGKRLFENISVEDTPHFILSKSERCPFLNTDKLCDIFIELGEDKLCNICNDHPRFRNFFSGYTEIGLGLCFEEAARIILTYPEKVTLKEISNDHIPQKTDDEEIIFLEFRQRLFDILQDRSISVNERLNNMLKVLNITVPQKSCMEWIHIYSKLEQLSPDWNKALKNLCEPNENIGFETAFEQLCIYFLYRHFADGLYDGRVQERVAFSAHTVDMIKRLCTLHFAQHNNLTVDNIAEYARMYSSEIEYNEDNLNMLISLMTQK